MTETPKTSVITFPAEDHHWRSWPLRKAYGINAAKIRISKQAENLIKGSEAATIVVDRFFQAASESEKPRDVYIHTHLQQMNRALIDALILPAMLLHLRAQGAFKLEFNKGSDTKQFYVPVFWDSASVFKSDLQPDAILPDDIAAAFEQDSPTIREGKMTLVNPFGFRDGYFVVSSHGLENKPQGLDRDIVEKQVGSNTILVGLSNKHHMRALWRVGRDRDDALAKALATGNARSVFRKNGHSEEVKFPETADVSYIPAP